MNGHSGHVTTHSPWVCFLNKFPCWNEKFAHIFVIVTIYLHDQTCCCSFFAHRQQTLEKTEKTEKKTCYVTTTSVNEVGNFKRFIAADSLIFPSKFLVSCSVYYYPWYQSQIIFFLSALLLNDFVLITLKRWTRHWNRISLWVCKNENQVWHELEAGDFLWFSFPSGK